MSFPVPQEEIFGSQKRGRSARASPSPHHTLAQKADCPFHRPAFFRPDGGERERALEDVFGI